MAEQKHIDWDRLRPIYESGRIAIRELARQFDCSEALIRKRAKAENWARDLSQRVLEKVRAQQVRDSVRIGPRTEAACVEAAAAEILQISDRQRAMIASLEGWVQRLIAQLKYEPTEDDAILSLEKDGRLDPKPLEIQTRLKEMWKAMPSPKEQANLLKTLTETVEKLIRLQRQAYGMDADIKSPSDIIGDVLDLVSARSRRCLPNSVEAL